MFGILGNIMISYSLLGKEYVDKIDLHGIARFHLSNFNDCEFIIDEIDYIEDTVYGVTLLVDIDEYEPIYVFGNSIVEFEIEQYKLRGNMTLSVC